MALPQRGSQPSLDLSPDATPTTAGWGDHYDDPMNDLNKPVPVRKGAADPNGWTKELWDTNQIESVKGK